MSVLDERSRIAVEINRLLGVEQHVLAGIHFQDEIFQGSHTYDAGNLMTLIFCHVVKFTQFHRGFVGIFHHQFHQVIGIHHRSLSRLHLAIGQFHHTVAEVCQFLTPLESESVEQYREHLEMVVLLVAHHVNHLINGEVFVTHLSRTNVLRHIDTCAIAAEQQLLVQALVS